MSEPAQYRLWRRINDGALFLGYPDDPDDACFEPVDLSQIVPHSEYHDDAQCAVCDGPLEVHNDAMCDKCRRATPQEPPHAAPQASEPAAKASETIPTDFDDWWRREVFKADNGLSPKQLHDRMKSVVSETFKRAESAEQANAELRAEVESLNRDLSNCLCGQLIPENEQLKAEVERLTDRFNRQCEDKSRIAKEYEDQAVKLRAEVERLKKALQEAKFNLFKEVVDILDPLVPTLSGSVTLVDIALAVKAEVERLTKERDEAIKRAGR